MYKEINRVAEHLKWDEYPEIQWDETNFEQLIDDELELSRIITAATKIRAHVRELIGEELGGRSYRSGDTIYRNQPDVVYRVKDSDGLWDFLGEEAREVIRADAGNVRRTALKAVAARRGLGDEAIYDTFFEREERENRVVKLPLFRARKAEQALEPGTFTDR